MNLRGKCLEAAFLVLPKILKEGLLQKDNKPNEQKGETSVENASSLILNTLDVQYEQDKGVQERLFDLRLQTAEAYQEGYKSLNKFVVDKLEELVEK